MKHFIAGLLVIVGVAVGGCATVVRQIAEPHQIEVASTPTATGLAIVVAPRRPFFGWPEAVGWGLDAYLAVNAANYSMIYVNAGSAAAIIGGSAAAAVLGDVAASRLVPLATPRGVRFVADAGAGPAIKEVPVTARGEGRFQAILPAADLRGMVGALRWELVSESGGTLHRDVVPADAIALAKAAAPRPAAEPQVSAPASPAPIAPATPADEVDSPPTTATRNPDAVAVVVGIERYAGEIPDVKFARRDAETFAAYLRLALGVPAENIIGLYDAQATSGSLRTAIEGQLRARLTEGRSDVYVFFAGHGVPDLKTRMAYLVPHDGNPAFPSTSCYPLSSAYAALAAMNARSVTVVLDSCFSGGAGRSDGKATLIANARPLFVQTKADDVPPGVTVFAAASGDQLSSSLERVRHGLFTYHFLAGLQGAADVNHDRRITVAELEGYLAKQVPREARRLNREQTPRTYSRDRERVLLKL